MPAATRSGIWMILAPGVLVALVAVVSFDRAARLRYDFSHFYSDAEYVWLHGELNPDLDNPDPALHRQLPFYLPVVLLLIAPLAAGGPTIAAALWTAMHVVSLLYALRVIGVWLADRMPRRGLARATTVVCALSVPAVFEAAKFNQLSFLVLALVLGATSSLEKRRPVRAGMLLGIATVVKLLPVLLVLWLAAKRRWTALGALAATVLIVALLPPLIAWGPSRTLEYHRQWWRYNVQGVLGEGMVEQGRRGHFVDHRNQSIRAVAGRLLGADHPYRAPLALGSLSESTVGVLSGGVALGLLGSLVWATRRRWQELAERAGRFEVAAYLIGLLVFAPLLRQYYLIWALPAVALLASAALGHTERGRRIGRVGLAVWLFGMLAWLSPMARVYGVHLAVVLALAVLVLWPARGGARAGLS